MTAEFGVLLPTREAVMSGRSETAPLLAVVAARTRRVRVGTAVLLPVLRHPVGLAQIVATLDREAEGRPILGVGIAADTNRLILTAVSA
jgi:alkanesulfonate monooxygenase SsuD/methylene tetrahydromethanopterin reductase-like flavin-dependent oxidoreductase (luciferase family)